MALCSVSGVRPAGSVSILALRCGASFAGPLERADLTPSSRLSVSGLARSAPAWLTACGELGRVVGVAVYVIHRVGGTLSFMEGADDR